MSRLIRKIKNQNCSWIEVFEVRLFLTGEVVYLALLVCLFFVCSVVRFSNYKGVY